MPLLQQKYPSVFSERTHFIKSKRPQGWCLWCIVNSFLWMCRKTKSWACPSVHAPLGFLCCHCRSGLLRARSGSMGPDRLRSYQPYSSPVHGPQSDRGPRAAHILGLLLGTLGLVHCQRLLPERCLFNMNAHRYKVTNIPQCPIIYYKQIFYSTPVDTQTKQFECYCTHGELSWLNAEIEPTIRGRERNEPSVQAKSGYNVCENPICSFGASIVSSICSWAVCVAERGTTFIHAVMHWRPFTCVPLWWFISAHPPAPTIARYAENLSYDPLLDWIHWCNTPQCSASLYRWSQIHCATQ